MMELSTDLSKELWDKIIFTDVIKPISCPINNTLSYIYIDPTDTHHNYIWLLPDGRLIRAYWVYSEKTKRLSFYTIYICRRGVFSSSTRKNMIEIPEYILWDGNTTNIEKWEGVTHTHFWFSTTTGQQYTNHYYGLLDDGRIVRITNLHVYRIDGWLLGDALYLGRG